MADERVILDTEVTAVGEQAGLFFDEGIIVLFGEDAPEELGEFAVLHRPTVPNGEVAAGDTVTIGDQTLHVLAVGEVANQNLANLGHLVLKRNGLDHAPLPGDVSCDAGPIPPIAAGSRIRITR